MLVPPLLERDLTVTQGYDLDEPFQWENPDDSPIDLTGWTARLEVRPRAGDSTLLLAFDTDPSAADALGRIEITAETGVIRLRLDRAAIWTLTRGGEFEMWLYPPDPAEEPVRFSRGRFLIETSTVRRGSEPPPSTSGSEAA